MTSPDEPQFVTVQATCRTDGCENIDVPIPLYVPADLTLFFCGPCGQQILDVVPDGADDEPPPE